MSQATYEAMAAEKPINVETSVTDNGNWAKKLTVTIVAADAGKEFDSVVGELASTVRLPGFRPGKVPRNVVEKKFGDEINKQVTVNLLQRGLRSAIDKEKLDLVGEPHLDPTQYKFERGQNFVFDVEVEVRPQFNVAQYKGLSIEQEEIEVLPDEMEMALNRIRERFGERVEAGADHAIKEGDVAKGVLRFLVDGNEVRKEDDAQLLIMEGHVFGASAHLGAKYLEGAKLGEKRTVEETLDERFPVESARGKKATIEFEVKSIQAMKLPELNDEFATKMGMKNVDELKDKVRESLLENVGEEIRKKTQYELLDKVVAGSPFDLPKRLSQSMSAQTMRDSINYMAQMGMDPQQIIGQKDDLTANANKRAEAEMRRFFVVDAIARQESLEVQDDDVDQEIVRLAREQKMRASELYDKLNQQGRLQELTAELRFRKVLEFLVENAEVKVVPRKPIDKNAGHAHPEHAPSGGHDHGHSHGHDCAHDHGHSHGHEHGHEHGH